MDSVEKVTCLKEENKPSRKERIKVTYYQLFWIFFIGSFLGVVLETIYCYFQYGKVESRVGLVIGPLNTVYGFGAVAMSLFASKFKEKNYSLIFLFCAIIGASFEYICSLFQEVVFNTVSWEYSTHSYNIGGRTSLKYAVFWGILGILWVKFFYPWYCSLIEKGRPNIKFWLTLLVTIFMVFNILISLMAVRRQTLRQQGTAKPTVVGQFLDRTFPDEYLKKLFPNTMKVDEIDRK